MKKIKDNDDKFSREVGTKANRMLKAQRENKRSAWSGFGLFGIVGWSVAAPTLAGVAAGTWLDRKYPQTISWTLSLLIIGLVIGCLIAWKFIDKEHKDMNQNNEEEK
ncbi:MAG: AtpZ/AtpI family protein [Bacteroidia bacterium]